MFAGSSEKGNRFFLPFFPKSAILKTNHRKEGDTMWVLILPGLLAALFLALGIVFLTGRGDCFIAGWNTSSEEQRKKYHRTKLLRSMAVFCFFTVAWLLGLGAMLVLAVQEILPESQLMVWGFVLLGLLLAGLAVEMIYANVFCRKKTEDPLTHKED